MQTKFRINKQPIKSLAELSGCVCTRNFCPNAKRRWRKKMGNIPAGTDLCIPLSEEKQMRKWIFVPIQ